MPSGSRKIDAFFFWKLTIYLQLMDNNAAQFLITPEYIGDL